MPEDLLREYWEQETEKRIFIFFQLVRKAADEFEYKGAGYTAQLRAVVPKRNPALYPLHSEDPIGSGGVVSSLDGVGSYLSVRCYQMTYIQQLI
jgi:hypothetical protein